MSYFMKHFYHILLLSIIWKGLFPDHLAAQKKPVGISGLVVAANSGEPLPGANISLLPGRRGTATDEHGRFQLFSLQPGHYQIRISFIGYQTFIDSLILTPEKSPYLRIRLIEKPIAGREVVVTADRDDTADRGLLNPQLITTTKIRQMSTIGEPDVMRALALQPGIASVNDYNTRFFVRGGRGNENQLLIEDVTIHNPYHALGFFSAFDVDAIKMVENYRGVAPSRYCERLSSVTNILLRDGHAQEIHGSGMVSLVSSKLLLEGPLLRYQPASGRKWTWMVSGRRTYFDLLVKFPYYFYDLSFKSVYDSGKHTRLIFHGYYGVDRVDTKIKEDLPKLHWKNRVASIRWFQFISPRLTWMNAVSYSDFATSSTRNDPTPDAGFDEPNQMNGIKEVNLVSEGNYNLFHDWFLTMGYQLSRYDMNQYLDTFFKTYFKERWQNFQQHKTYLSLKANWGPRWQGDFGVTWLNIPFSQTDQLAPRLGLQYRLSDTWKLAMGYGHHFQALTTINDDHDPVVFFDAWIPSPKNQPIAAARHLGLGLNGSINKLARLNWEVYYRRYSDLLRFNRIRYWPEEKFYLPGWAESYGTELELNISHDRYDGMLNVSWMRATSHFWLRNQPMHHLNDFRWYSFPSSGDIRLAINCYFSFRFRRKWDIGIAGIFQSGRPGTVLIGRLQHFFVPGENSRVYHSIDEGSTVYSSPNAYRFPFYQRLDLKISRKFTLYKTDGEYFFQIYNLLCRLNTAFYFPANSVWDDARVIDLPILPTFGVSFKF